MSHHTKPWPEVPVTNKDFTQAAVVIIGGGISGICTAIDLIRRQNCRNFIIVEKSSGVGGTWHDNKYPGCCCDVWSLLYSYSFEQNPNWSRLYPGQEEILDYLHGVADKYGLFQHIRFNTSVDKAVWDDEEKKWKTTVKVSGDKDREFTDGYTITSDFLVSGVGQLNVPYYPDIMGIDDFKGKKMHSARWDWSYPLDKKRIAVIGNGATAAQIIPEVVKVASHVTVYQRQANWVIPRLDENVPMYMRKIFKYVPFVQSRTRAGMMDFRESFFDAVTAPDSDFAKLLQSQCEELMEKYFGDDEETKKKLTPNYPVGCKRVIISDDLYPAMAQPHVDLETRPIAKITETGIEVADGAHEEYDLIVLATGFRTVEFMYPIEVRGKNGREISDIWKSGAEAYYSVTVEDLPNFGMLYGPNSNLGHNSIILMIEAQSRYINALIGEVLKAKRAGKTLSIRPNPEVVRKYNEWLQEILEKTSFADPRCTSWYKNKEGKITNNWALTVVEYQKFISSVNWQDYIIEGTGSDDLRGKRPTKLGRVVEETQISNLQLALGAISVVAVAAGIFARGGLRNVKLPQIRIR